jgi:hypothetical protein
VRSCIYMQHRAFIIVVAITAGLTARTTAGIIVTPTSIDLNAAQRSARLVVKNTGTTVRSIEIEVRFGFPVADDQGQSKFQFIDTGTVEPSSAVRWIRIYPPRFELAPGELQIVAIVANPPVDLSDGEYWVRPVVSSKPVGSANAASSNATDLFTHEVVLRVSYFSGSVSTGVAIGQFEPARTDSGVSVKLELIRTGNCAFRGSIHYRLLDLAGQAVTEREEPVAVYYRLQKTIVIQFDGARRQYGRIELVLTNDRPPAMANPAPQIVYIVPLPSITAQTSIQSMNPVILHQRHE